MATPEKVTVSLWPGNRLSIDAVIKAHHDWLEHMRKSSYAKDVEGLRDWTPADVINNVLKEYAPVLQKQYEG